MKLHIFNPEHDIALAHNNPYFTAPHAGRQLRADLGFIPALWASDGDLVLVDDVAAALEHVRHLKCRIPEVLFITKNDLKSVETDVAEERSRVSSSLQIEPWGWDLAIHHQLKKAGISPAFMPSAERLRRIRMISGRQWTAEMLMKVLPGFADGVFDVPRSAASVDELVRLYERHYDSSAVLKEPWSSSGRGVRYVRGSLTPPMLNWVARVIAQQGHIMLEPYYDNKVKDFAAEFLAHPDGTITYEGLSLFHTTKGAYSGNIIASEQEKRQMLSRHVSLADLDAVVAVIIQCMRSYLQNVYVGPFGVDMMALGGGLLYPCVELNLRRTMGHVALAVTPSEPSPQRLLRITYTDRYHLQLMNTFENVINNSLM